MEKKREPYLEGVISLKSRKSILAILGMGILLGGTITVSALHTADTAKSSTIKEESMQSLSANVEKEKHTGVEGESEVALAAMKSENPDADKNEYVSDAVEPAPVQEESSTEVSKNDKEIEEKIGKTTKEKSEKEKKSSKQEGETGKWKAKVKQTASVSDSYFDDALFIGASRMQGFQNLSGLGKGTYMTEIGLGVDKALTKDFVRIGKEKVTLPVALTKGKYKKVYLMFGINEVGWPYPDMFIEDYRKVVQTVKKAQPDATIYVQSIIQCSKSKAAEHSYFGIKNINKFNRLILNMCSEERIYFLNLNEVLAGSDGYLPNSVTTDGIHMNADHCKKWLAYLKTHTV